MSDPKLTGWFPPEVRPVRVGAYEREYGKEGEPSNIGKCWWNGKTFGYSDENVGKEREFASSKQNLPWRGLASDPSKGEVTK